MEGSAVLVFKHSHARAVLSPVKDAVDFLAILAAAVKIAAQLKELQCHLF